MTAERDQAGHPVEWRVKKIRITRPAIWKEDAEKMCTRLLMSDRFSYIDLIGGTPLAEIVNEPDFPFPCLLPSAHLCRRAGRWYGSFHSPLDGMSGLVRVPQS